MNLSLKYAAHSEIGLVRPAPMMDNDIPTTESQVKSTEQAMVSRAWALSR